jgi:hypothetical protein
MDTSRLARFLETDPLDAGCDETFALIDAYVERTLTHGDAEEHYPGIAVHLRRCPPCVQDFEGLLAAVGSPPS